MTIKYGIGSSGGKINGKPNRLVVFANMTAIVDYVLG